MSIVFFCHGMVHMLKETEQESLQQLGFGWSTGSADAATSRCPSGRGEEQFVDAPRGADGQLGQVCRNLVHGCCEKGSLMTRPTPYSQYCNFVEITKEIDARSQNAIKMAKDAIAGPNDTIFWCEPCTGGQYVSR